MSVIRKCNECSKDINITLDEIDNVIYFDRKCYHLDCFVKMCERKSANKRCSKKWSEALINLKQHIDTSLPPNEKTNIQQKDTYVSEKQL